MSKLWGISFVDSNFAVFFAKLSLAISLTYRNTVRWFGIRKWWRPWQKMPGTHRAFTLANHTLRDRYYKSAILRGKHGNKV